MDFSSAKGLPSKWAANTEKKGGAAVASSGLKHGGPRIFVEGRAKL
jgi:hypothetical protein